MPYDHEEYQKEAQRRLEASKCYEVILSTKDRIQCDADEFNRIVEGIKTGSMIKIRQGFINPSFIVTVVLDEKRYGDFLSEVRGVIRNNEQEMKIGGSSLRRLPEFKSLKDIFAGTPLKIGDKALPAPKKTP